jgi:hypothetical protein
MCSGDARNASTFVGVCFRFARFFFATLVLCRFFRSSDRYVTNTLFDPDNEPRYRTNPKSARVLVAAEKNTKKSTLCSRFRDNLTLSWSEIALHRTQCTLWRAENEFNWRRCSKNSFRWSEEEQKEKQRWLEHARIIVEGQEGWSEKVKQSER